MRTETARRESAEPSSRSFVRTKLRLDEYHGNVGAKIIRFANYSHEHFASQNVLVKRLNSYLYARPYPCAEHKEIPSSNFRTPSKSQIQKQKSQTKRTRLNISGFEYWILFGIWCLVIGISSRSARGGAATGYW